MVDVIEVRDLHKNFGRVRALRGLNLRVKEGSIHGFLGPNGAGKTTTLRILLGLYRADSGKVSLLGKPLRTASVEHNSQISYVPGDVALWPNLRGDETLDLLANLRGIRNKARETELIEQFELDPTRKVGQYSKGNRQKFP